MFCELAIGPLKAADVKIGNDPKSVRPELDGKDFLTHTNHLPIFACGDVADDTHRHGLRNPTKRI